MGYSVHNVYVCKPNHKFHAQSLENYFALFLR